MRRIGLRLTFAGAMALGVGAGGTALGQDKQDFEASTVLRLRIPLGQGVEERTKTISLVSTAGLKPQIDAPAFNPPPRYRLAEAGLAFNGDAFASLAAAQVRAVRIGLVPHGRRLGERLPTPPASPALP